LKAAIFHGKENMKVEEVESPKAKHNEVLVEVEACGICGTDVHILKGEYPVNGPLILGHEASGRIVEVGKEVETLKVGDSVAIDPNIFCGKCYFCRIGEAHLCRNLKAVGVTRNGAFAEYVAVPEENLYKLPKNVSYEEAALAEPLSCCIHGVDLAQIKSGDTVVVLGAGPIGLLHTQLVRILGASKVTTITGHNEEKLAFARKLGADDTINASLEDPVSKVRASSSGIGADVVVEATGNPVAVEQAIKMARRGGRVIIFGCAPEKAKIEVSPYIINDSELMIFGAFNNPYTMSRAIRLIGSGKIKTKHLISHEFGLDNILKAFETIRSGTLYLKILVKP